MNVSIFAFIFSMWVLILLGGGVLVLVSEPVRRVSAGDSLLVAPELFWYS